MEASKPLDLERELTCSICTEILYQPLTLLDCLHTFCGCCLKEWFDHVAAKIRAAPDPPSASTAYTCPACRSPVRDTGQNSTVNTLLDMFLVANPDRARDEAERTEIARRYRPGDTVLPRIRERDRDRERERRRRRAAERDMLEVEEGGAAAGPRRPSTTTAASSGRPRPHDADNRDRSRDRQRTTTRQAEDRATRERRRRDYDEDWLNDDDEGGASRQVEHQSSLRSLFDSAEPSEGSGFDIEREIEEFARQIQEEGLLDGLDLENIDLSRDDELSNKIRDAFRRRWRDRARRPGGSTVGGSGSGGGNGSGSGGGNPVGGGGGGSGSGSGTGSGGGSGIGSGGSTVGIGSATGSGVGGHSRASSSASRMRERERERERDRDRDRDQNRDHHHNTRRSTSTHHTIHSRTSSATSQTQPDDRERPRAATSQTQPDDRERPRAATTTTATSQHLEIYPDDRRRRRTGSNNGRSSTTPIPPPNPPHRLEARSQTDLNRLMQAHSLAEAARPATTSLAGGRSTSSPTVPTAPGTTAVSPMVTIEMPPYGGSLGRSFAARAGSFGQSSPMQTSTATSPSLPPSSRIARNARPSDLAIGNLSLPPTLQSSSSSTATRSSPKRNAPLFQEPLFPCSACHRENIQYELHYNCSHCDNGEWNICLDCYRSSKGCHNWFGFGYAAWPKWERAREAAGASNDALFPRPHVLTACRYLAPRPATGTSNALASSPTVTPGRRTLTTDDPQKRLESGNFCSRCLAWANDCWWRCDSCNDGEWGFCNDCVNQGRSCSHPLLPLTYDASSAHQYHQQSSTSTPPATPNRPPPSASVLTGPGATAIGPFKPLTFTTRCDLCQDPIPPLQARLHCFSCTSTLVPTAARGDYDVCVACYDSLGARGLVARHNGVQGWRRCLRGHRMVVVAFRNGKIGQWRHVVADLVGGHGLRMEDVDALSDGGGVVTTPIQRWSWYDSSPCRMQCLVARDDVGMVLPPGLEAHQPSSSTTPLATPSTPPTTSDSSAPSSPYHSGPSSPTAQPLPIPPTTITTDTFPPEGGSGAKAVSIWSFFSSVGGALTFPRGAEISEIEDVNGDWWFGIYMGNEGVFPASYVRVRTGDVVRVGGRGDER